MIEGRLRGALLAAGVLAAAAGGGAAIAGATVGGDDQGRDRPITASQLREASAIALRQTGGGRVTGSEIRDEEGYCEVEVTRGDGSQVDVHLDRVLKVLGAHSDGDGSQDGGSDGG